MYKVGDEVRMIPESYFQLFKGDLHHSIFWQKPDPAHDDRVMLGGRYTVLEVSPGKSGVFYRLIDNNELGEFYRENFLILDSEVRNCPYKVGDKVLFRPKCSALETKALKKFEHLKVDDLEAIHEVRAAINDYYVVVDLPVDSPYACPIRWVDLELVKER
jgi:hypothetical protein